MNAVNPDYPTRQFHPGMGQAVAERTILREKGGKGSGLWEDWGDVAHRVSLGNSLLCPTEGEQLLEYELLRKYIGKATMLTSGRHLQHGDENQPNRNMEVFTNCFRGDTTFLTLEQGPVSLASVAGKTVTVKCADGQWRAASVNRHGRQALRKITFKYRSSKQVVQHVATANHRWLLSDGSVTTSLNVGDTLLAQPDATVEDQEAILHGLVFGDGCAHKAREDFKKPLVSQGRTYASIRLCGQKSEFLPLFEGYDISHPQSANGDPVVYVGKKPFWKDVPFTNDPNYIAGFIRGWWLADGEKSECNSLVISSSNEDAVQWLMKYAPYADYTVVGYRVLTRSESEGCYANGKPLHIVRLRKGVEWTVREIECAGEDEVFCVEEPETSTFVLGSGLTTGNCSTSASSFAMFYLLMNGSGVGRCYDDDMMLVDWDNAPQVRCVLSHEHRDFDFTRHESVRDARHKYGAGKDVIWHEVGDHREGWAKALELYEVMAFEKIHRDKMLILDFSKVRCKNTPIGGMQGRPASGPVPLMDAFEKAAKIKGARLPRWIQAMFVDHYFAECVLVGGARRAARWSGKHWKDRSVLQFITVKRPIEYHDMGVDEIVTFRGSVSNPPQGFLWSSNNSVMVDREFWSLLDLEPGEEGYDGEWAIHARAVFKLATEAAYGDGTGEPGFLNVDTLVHEREGTDKLKKLKGQWFGSKKYSPEEDTEVYLDKLMTRALRKPYFLIVNPCSEIQIALFGAFCVIGDLVPFFADSLEEVEEAARAMVRFLMRVNLMDSVYKPEVRRTNRIGVGLTGIHEFAWKFFKLGFRDLLDERKSKSFWQFMSRVRRAIRKEAVDYAKFLGVEVPHTDTTVKPSGTVSKLWGLTEGWHLPSMAWYLRWVQFRIGDPLVDQYAANGYPVRELVKYPNTVIVGFPTTPVIADLGMVDKLVTAAEATPEEQYKWLMLGEKYWIRGVDDEGEPLSVDTGNQISYTLKYDPDKVSFAQFRRTVRKYQAKVKCCSVMPQEKSSSYEYLPEEPVTKAQYESVVRGIRTAMREDVDKVHVDCAGGACPIDFQK